mmetsp:Transcript_5835/g.14396  ORF Transcript_5835/g.14396 Transcript_5835/m.14396 type:complete len:323 (+) Transcript_5835:97-1065(+)
MPPDGLRLHLFLQPCWQRPGVARGIVSAQRLPASLEQDGLCELGRAPLLRVGHRLLAPRERERVGLRVLDRAEQRVEADRHEAEVVPVVPVVDVVVVAAHHRPRERADVRVDVQRPQPREHLHRVDERDGHGHEERAHGEGEALGEAVLRGEGVAGEGVELVGVLVHVVVRVLPQPLAHVPLVQQVVVVDEDDQLERTKVGEAAEQRAHRAAAVLHVLARHAPPLHHEEVRQDRHHDVQRERVVRHLYHVVHQLLRHRARGRVRISARIVHPHGGRHRPIENVDQAVEEEPSHDPAAQVREQCAARAKVKSNRLRREETLES